MRQLTAEEIRNVTGGMRGNPGSFIRDPYLPRTTEPEFHHLEYPMPGHAPSVAQSATCAMLGMGVALMALPLGPAGFGIAGMTAKALCDEAFKNAQR